MTYLQLKLVKFGVWLFIAVLPLIYMLFYAAEAPLWWRWLLSILLFALAIAAVVLDTLEYRAARRMIDAEFEQWKLYIDKTHGDLSDRS